MKKLLLVVLVSLCFVGSALAAPMTWTDTINWEPDHYVGWYDSFTYTHDITDEGFVPFEDIVFNYSLEVALYDDGGSWDFSEIAFIDQPGLLADGGYNFSYTSNTYGWSLAGLILLNIDGSIDVTVGSSFGDFYLDYSTLTANGCDNAPVPEPATLLLLGSGLAGLAFYRRKRK